MEKAKKVAPVVYTNKPYVPASHPQQHRIDDMRVIASLVTTNPEHAPKGK